MAIVKFGPMVVGARGVVGGVIFSANGGGPFIRAYSRGSNPRTSLQQNQRQRLSFWASEWRALTQVQRDDWIDYADDAAQQKENKLGELYFASGFNWYVAINTNLEAAGAASRDDAPTFTPPVAPQFTIQSQQRFFTTGSTTTSSSKFLLASPEIGELHVLFCRVTGQGSSSSSGNFQFVRMAIPDGGGRVGLQTPLQDVFGTILINTRLHVIATVQDTQGRRGPPDSVFKDVESD